MATSPAAAASRPRAGGGRLFIIVGLVLALLAFGGVVVIGGTLGGGGGIGGAKTDVLVAAEQINYRTTITAADLTTKQFDQADVPTGAYLTGQKSSLVGSVAELNILKGQAITNNMVAKSASDVLAPTSSYLPLPSGWVGYTMPTSEQQGVGGYPQVGDYITVIASADLSLFSTSGQQVGPTKFVTKTVFTNLRIIRVGPAGGGNGTTGTNTPAQGGLTSSITVELTQCDAEFMTWLEAKTTLKYTLESYHDYAPAPTGPDASCASVAAAQGVGNPQVDSRWHFSAI